MDTSKEYIKQCDCPEVQGRWKPHDGDWVGRLHKISQKYKVYPHAICTDALYDVEQYAKYNKWLPRQDQTQEMMPEKNCKCSCCLIFRLNKFVEDNIDGFAEAGIDSIEQYWLAFYMWKNHQKIWDGKKWVKSETE